MSRSPVIPGTTPDGRGSVHALVIGVGRYDDPTLGLAAAAPSALAFADWLLHEHAPPGLARGSIDVLASTPGAATVDWEGHTLDPPTLGNVEAAAEALVARADADPGSMIVFYFCGHGVQNGGLRSLLLQDVDLTSRADPFRKAIAFENFAAGLTGCGPRRQLFVLDACRELPLALAKWDDDVGLGERLVRCNKARRALLPKLTQVVLEGASDTQKAWQGAERGWFTEALLTVLKGAAGNNRFTSANEYPVSTRDIADTIQFLVEGGFIDKPAGPQVPERNGIGGDFNLHLPERPVVPILVTRRPPSTNCGATFRAVQPTPSRDIVASFTCPRDEPWRWKLPVGDYVFQCNAAEVPTHVSVPAKRVELP